MDGKTLIELSIKHVETKKHEIDSDVYKLLKLVLLLPMMTASLERSFFGMNHILVVNYTNEILSKFRLFIGAPVDSESRIRH